MSDEQGCGKITYRNKRDARMSKRRHRKKQRKVRFYKCPDCGFWHITSGHAKLDANIRDVERQVEFMEALQSKKADFIRKISNTRSVWRMSIPDGRFIVTYNKKHKSFEINHYLGKG